MKIVISELEKIARTEYKYYKELNIDTYSTFIGSEFSWACDECLSSKKAIKANRSLQNYCWYPNYAYHDAEMICQNCDERFLFSKEEKKYWYESLKFWIDSEPINCVNCRKEIRGYKMENKILSETLKKREAEISMKELEEVIVIYRKWKKESKVKYYESLLRKRK